MKPCRLVCLLAWALGAAASTAAPAATTPGPEPVPASARAALRLGLEFEHFRFPGGWTVSTGETGTSGGAILAALQGADLPAATAITIPRAGHYRLWVRTTDFPGDRPGTRLFRVALGGRANTNPFGRTRRSGWIWEQGDVFELPAGPLLIILHDQGGSHFGRADALILSDDPAYVPRGRLTEERTTALAHVDIPGESAAPAVPVTPVEVAPGGGAIAEASLANEHLRVRFRATVRGGRPSFSPEIECRTPTGWIRAPLDPSAESYQLVSAEPGVKFELKGFHPQWSGPGERAAVKIEVAGVKVETRARAAGRNVIWGAGRNRELVVRTVTPAGPGAVALDFHPTEVGTLRARWELAPGARSVRVELAFTPAADGQYTLGYLFPLHRRLADVEELLLPMLVQRKRFPSTDYTLLHAACPTPVSLAQVAAAPGVALTAGVAGDPGEIAHEFPAPSRSRFGLHVRSPRGLVQPSIYGPLIGQPGSRVRAGQPVRFALRLLVQSGDWYAAYRTAADEIYGWRDYRRNGSVSLTESALNQLDLYLDDEYGGWWERARAPYQIESKNGSTQSTPLTALSLYRLTGDRELYRRRTLPTLEFLLSRDGPHFSPLPHETGRYPEGAMQGPLRHYGTTVLGGAWELMNRRTPALRRLALPDRQVRLSPAASGPDAHLQSFDEWLGRHLLTGEPEALARAIREADDYIARVLTPAPTRELGLPPFFLISFTPAWEGLLRLYEVTREPRFLAAAVQGARLVMTGMWTQPTPTPEPITIHPGGDVHGDLMDRKFQKGPIPFRLGWPRRPGDTPEHTTPGWLVSPVGLGFEQPSTYTIRDNGGRMILQAPWTPGFLRLALYSGDRQFETYARNAALARGGNYPGYYYTTFTDLMQDPRYPYLGPDVGFIYYHHIAVHLSWVLDYLVSEALLRSGGAITFPSLRQFGYAYFDYLVYGHAPGTVCGVPEAWLWLRRGLVDLDNPQINYLTAHTRDRLLLVLMNENDRPETVNVTFRPEHLPAADRMRPPGPIRFLAGGSGERALSPARQAQVTVAARGLTVLELAGLALDVSTHRRLPSPGLSEHSDQVAILIDERHTVTAVALRAEPGPWQAYVWSSAATGTLRELVLEWRAGDISGELRTSDYPYEFSVPVPAGPTAFHFRVRGTRSDGTAFAPPAGVIGSAE